MSLTYDDLVKMDAVKYVKEDILIEAVRDLYYLSHIKQTLLEERGLREDKEATIGTVKIVTDLISQNYCYLATWGKEKGTFEEVTMTPRMLQKLIDQYQKPKVFPFDYFLLPTEKGKEWVARYETLLDEL